jgi:hypothetical protein
MQEKTLKIGVCLVVFLTFASAYSQCTRDDSNILDQVATNGLKSLDSLHDYVWILESHSTVRDEKGNTKKYDFRQQTIVADGQMYTRALQPDEVPAVPESKASLSSGYRVSPALYGDCGGQPCGTYPYAFLVMTYMARRWDIRQVREGELNGVPVLVIDLRQKGSPQKFPQHFSLPEGTAWVEPEHCRLLRLIASTGKPTGHYDAEEILEFGEIKGNWLPLKREFHFVRKGKTDEYVEDYTYLKFGSSLRILP